MTVLESDAEIVFWEIVCYYCPNCLFEVPTASVKAEKNRCARNCFECPICLNTLSVISSVDPEKEPSPPTWADRASSTPNSLHSPGLSAGNVHYLLCGLCRWDSLEINLKFDRPTGLAIQLQKTEDDRDDVKEFENLRDHFEQIFRSNATGAHSSSLRNSGLNISSSLLASIPSLASLSSYSSKRSSNFSSSSKETINTYKSLIDSSEIVDEDSNLHYEDGNFTIHQHY
ncbi:hypothetical protein HK099_005218 [Clydaea vesicula]|uniref:Dynactin subunit 4 n=1 Tax=Clydaea vesicula TaxID=447962 RepID=A0AAD5XZP7_9FUNG|nr:hypothetical protein HK099_005218 [Clydaea vesicula]